MTHSRDDGDMKEPRERNGDENMLTHWWVSCVSMTFYDLVTLAAR